MIKDEYLISIQVKGLKQREKIMQFLDNNKINYVWKWPKIGKKNTYMAQIPDYFKCLNCGRVYDWESGYELERTKLNKLKKIKPKVIEWK